jgi:hypothetical protein
MAILKMNPYERKPKKAFWKHGVTRNQGDHFPEIYTPRFQIDKDWKIAAAGSCFAQHIGRQFKERGYNFLDFEPAPPQLPTEDHARLGFSMYSARYGNVYSMNQMLQLLLRAKGRFKPREEFWEQDGRWYDPFRPNIQAGGFESLEEARKDRAYHLSAVKRLVTAAELFVFTCGLTEAWICKRDGAVLPTCPGTVAGEFDPKKYEFRNFGFGEVLEVSKKFIKLARRMNKNLKFLFTVSPVPLTATATDQHVLPASVYSKSVLRAVCGELYQEYDFVDYFPSYELVASHPKKGEAFAPNLRQVTPDGVQRVMNHFFGVEDEPASSDDANIIAEVPDQDDVVCEEMMLEEFSK